MKDFILARLQEGSTIRGLIWFAAAFGVFHATSEQSEAITALCMALGGLAGAVTPDRLRRELDRLPNQRGPRV
jgi:hypothetical protein